MGRGAHGGFSVSEPMRIRDGSRSPVGLALLEELRVRDNGTSPPISRRSPPGPAAVPGDCAADDDDVLAAGANRDRRRSTSTPAAASIRCGVPRLALAGVGTAVNVNAG